MGSDNDMASVRRANVNETIKMSLLCEVKGLCPLCYKELIKQDSKKTVRVFDVAHIYPLNPTPHEIELLKKEDKITEDIDSEDNFIPLCKECHKIYDTKKTINEYRQLLSIKKTILNVKKTHQIWNNQQLHDDILQVANALSILNIKNIEATKLSLDALKLSEKKDDSLNLINEIKISEYIRTFYIPIKNAFKQLELEGKR
jgi:acetolactate synthase small subunit